MQQKLLFWVLGRLWATVDSNFFLGTSPRLSGRYSIFSTQVLFLVCTNPVQWNPAASHHLPIDFGGWKREVVDWRCFLFLWVFVRKRIFHFCFGAWGFFLRPPPQTLVNSRKQNSPYTWRRRVRQRFIFYSARFLRRKTHYDNSVRMCACVRLVRWRGRRVKLKGWGGKFIR